MSNQILALISSIREDLKMIEEESLRVSLFEKIADLEAVLEQLS